MKRILIVISSIAVLTACATRSVSKSFYIEPVTDRYSYFLIDSMLQYGLDHEALYTLLGNVKPMSSLVGFSFPIANADTSLSVNADILNRNEHGVYLDRIRTIQEAINAIQLPDIKIVMIPYESPWENKRLIQINVIRISALDSLLKAKEDFFGQFGFVPGTDPAVVVNTIEYSGRYERFRGYGYLFGYPDYAVDFFVRAFQTNDRTGRFVERKFFQIPAYSGKEGQFVYAYPKDMEPTAEVDSVLYHRANYTLKQYEQIRSAYLNADSTVQAYKLLKDAK
ncbi:MAG: hypothetical protein LBJ72_10270 [Dysgonamonadaceae bacterium]|jgi:hypothetical protein|nr:hypothetical protein [Dysgonamonadaceae bacterium]